MRVQRLLPRHCLLCGVALPAQTAGVITDAPVCPGCHGDLPWLPARHCTVCAVPLTSGDVCGACLVRPPRVAQVSAALLYRYPADALVLAFKYGGNLALGGALGSWLAGALAARADCIVPMPLAPARLRSRGFNQAQEIARHVARCTGIALAGNACRRVRDTAPQAALPWAARARNVRGAFACDADLSGLDVAVVDDVMTTGATLDELARTLYRAGAARVSAWVVARAVRREDLFGTAA